MVSDVTACKKSLHSINLKGSNLEKIAVCQDMTPCQQAEVKVKYHEYLKRKANGEKVLFKKGVIILPKKI